LRTPLAVLRGQAELALSRPRENREYVKALQVCQTSAERMSDLVERLLMLARADADFPGMAPTLVDMTKLVVEVVAELPEPDSVEVATSRAVVWGDGVLLRQLVQNLVGNALKHGGRSVRVSIRTREGRVILKVRDKGPGIAVGHLDHIFDRFYRIDKARARADGGAGGTGLGLSICREIVLRHDGEINCQSIVGHETLFRVELPAFDESVENRRQSPGGLPPHAQGK
jgi:signal transduction histidine kinase